MYRLPLSSRYQIIPGVFQWACPPVNLSSVWDLQCARLTVGQRLQAFVQNAFKVWNDKMRSRYTFVLWLLRVLALFPIHFCWSPYHGQIQACVFCWLHTQLIVCDPSDQYSVITSIRDMTSHPFLEASAGKFNVIAKLVFSRYTLNFIHINFIKINIMISVFYYVLCVIASCCMHGYLSILSF